MPVHPAALADDQRAFPDLAEGIHIAAADGADQLRHRIFAVVGGMQVHRGQRRIQVGGEELVVAADQGYILRDTQVEVWQIPASGYVSIRTSLAMLQQRLAPCGEVGAYLLRQMDEYNNGPWAGWTAGESWSLGDNPSVAVVIDDCAGRSQWENAWLIDAETNYTEEIPDRKIRIYHTMNSHFVLEDLFAKLQLNFGQ